MQRVPYMKMKIILFTLISWKREKIILLYNKSENGKYVYFFRLPARTAVV